LKTFVTILSSVEATSSKIVNHAYQINMLRSTNWTEPEK